jgi:hypothetical protein
VWNVTRATYKYIDLMIMTSPRVICQDYEVSALCHVDILIYSYKLMALSCFMRSWIAK